MPDFYSKVLDISKRYLNNIYLLNDQLNEGILSRTKYNKERANIFISKYANKNLDEFLAESFTNYKLSSNPSPYAREIGKLIEDKFKK